jgi:predicted helicase
VERLRFPQGFRQLGYRHVFILRNSQPTSGELSRKEGGKILGSGNQPHTDNDSNQKEK